MNRLLIALACVLFLPAFAQAQELVWAADAEGGAPFVFPDPANPTTLVGFEVDLVTELAGRIGRTPRFVQNQWDGLVPGLERGEYDIIINGIEITPERREVILFSNPYYVSSLVLTVRQEEGSVRSVNDLRGRRAGALKASFADRYLRTLEGVDVRSYDSQVQAYLDLGLGRLDGVVADSIVPPYYVAPNPQLRDIAIPGVQFEYGIGLRRSDSALRQEIDSALDSMRRDGTLKRIYSRWGIYNPETAAYLRDDRPLEVISSDKYNTYLQSITPDRTASDKIARYGSLLPLLLQGAAVTVGISVVSMALAMAIGLALALLRLYGPRWTHWPALIFIEVVRGTPLLIQLFILFYGLPAIGIRLSPFWAAVLGLGINYGAYEAENYRAGIQTVPQGQVDAATALGLTRLQTIRRVIMPQAFRAVIPPVTNDFIALLKDSSLVSVITMVELTKVYGQLAAAYFDYIGLGILTAAIYMLLGLPIARLSKMLERRLSYMKA